MAGFENKFFVESAVFNCMIVKTKFGSVNILMELFKKHSIDARYHLCLIIVVELIVATFLGCLEVCLRTLARSL